MPDAGRRTPDAGRRTPDAGRRAPDTDTDTDTDTDADADADADADSRPRASRTPDSALRRDLVGVRLPIRGFTPSSPAA
jgi:hypothetical protein